MPAKFKAVRLMGTADTDQLRMLAGALHFAGKTGDLRVGVRDDGEWSWRTPLLTADQLHTFKAAMPLTIVAVQASPTTPGHANILAMIGEEV